jgi:hypothetical protein
MKNKFDFYEIVNINSENNELSKIHGKEGVVLGMAENDDGAWSYAVSINNGYCWSIEEEYLVSTGKFSSRDQFYSGETVKIIVNDKGEGEIKGEN